LWRVLWERRRRALETLSRAFSAGAEGGVAVRQGWRLGWAVVRPPTSLSNPYQFFDRLDLQHILQQFGFPSTNWCFTTTLDNTGVQLLEITAGLRRYRNVLYEIVSRMPCSAAATISLSRHSWQGVPMCWPTTTSPLLVPPTSKQRLLVVPGYATTKLKATFVFVWRLI
jgi:hypothetical protein